VGTAGAPDEVGTAGAPDEVKACPLTFIESAINTMNAIRKRILIGRVYKFDEKRGR